MDKNFLRDLGNNENILKQIVQRVHTLIIAHQNITKKGKDEMTYIEKQQKIKTIDTEIYDTIHIVENFDAYHIFNHLYILFTKSFCCTHNICWIYCLICRNKNHSSDIILNT